MIFEDFKKYFEGFSLKNQNNQNENGDGQLYKGQAV